MLGSFSSFCRYLYLHKGNAKQQHIWDTALHEYILSGVTSELCTTLITHLEQENPTSLAQQFTALGSISNYHWWHYIRCDGQVSTATFHVNLHEHFLYHPSCEDTDGCLRYKHLPKSPRNRLMYYILNEDVYPGLAQATLKELIKIDTDGELSPFHSISEEAEEPPQKKRRKHSSKVLTLTADILCNSLGMEPSHVKNYADSNRTLYTVFSEQLKTCGTTMWRQHSSLQDTIVMSDYDCKSGFLSPSSFVHVTCTFPTENHEENYLLKCSCQAYSVMQNIAISNVTTPCGDSVLDHKSVTCMHCRFYKEHLLKHRLKLENRNNLEVYSKEMRASGANLNDPVVLLGIADVSGTTKLSVTFENTHAMVHINFTPSGACYANCQNGECCARMLNKKKVPKEVSVQNELQNLCGHIKTLHANLEILRKIFPLYFATLEEPEDSDTNQCQTAMVENTDDANLLIDQVFMLSS